MTQETATAGDVDVWSWASGKTIDVELKNLLTLRHAVLSGTAARRRLEEKVATLGPEPKGEDALRAGLGRWLLAQYSRAIPHLEASTPQAGAAYALAECHLFGGQTSLDGTIVRPERTIEILKAVKKKAAAETTLLLRAYMQLERYDDCKKALEDSDAAYRASNDGRYFGARLAEADGNVAAAVAEYEAILDIDADHELTCFRLAFRAELVGDDDRAMELYESLSDREPPLINALMNLAVLHEDREEYSKAADCYRRVLEVYPLHPRARLFLKDAEASFNMFYDEDHEVRQDRKNQILKIPVSDFELSVRSRNCLAKMNIVTLGDLVAKSEPELLSYKNFGETSLNEIKQILDSKGLRLGMRPEDDLQPVKTQQQQQAQRRAVTPNFSIDPNDERLKKPVSELALSVRARKCLANLNIKAIGELVVMTTDDLLGQRNFGVTSLKEIVEQLSLMGLSLRTVDK